MGLLLTLLYIIFVLSAIVLVVVILLQEGKGGGFGGALGGAGEQTFGPGAKGINTFTAWLAGVFLVSALAIHVLNREQGSGSVLEDSPSIDAIDGQPIGGAAGDGAGGAQLPDGR